MPANPIRVGGPEGTSSWTATSAPPVVGQHTGEVMAEAGFSEEEVSELRSAGVV